MIVKKESVPLASKSLRNMDYNKTLMAYTNLHTLTNIKLTILCPTFLASARSAVPQVLRVRTSSQVPHARASPPPTGSRCRPPPRSLRGETFLKSNQADG